MKLTRYLKNLWKALTCRNPYEEELEEQQRLHSEAEAKVQAQDAELRVAKKSQAVAEEQVGNYQNLTENLRKRITEKEIENDRQRSDYTQAVNTLREQHRLQREELEQKNQELRDDLQATLDQLQRVNHDIGREMMSTNMLHKTNAALNDLCTAMRSEDVEKMKSVAEYLNWSNPLSQIVQLHLNVLTRKQELEERTKNDETPK